MSRNIHCYTVLSAGMCRRNGVHPQLNNVVTIVTSSSSAIVSDAISFCDKLARGTEKYSAPKIISYCPPKIYYRSLLMNGKFKTMRSVQTV